MWKKVNKGEGRHGFAGRDARQSFAVTRPRSGTGSAQLVIPGWAYNDEPRCTIYEDGNKLAFHFSARGEYAVNKTSPQAKARQVTIPARFGRSLPYGTHDISYTMDGDKIVIDLSPLMVRVATE